MWSLVKKSCRTVLYENKECINSDTMQLPSAGGVLCATSL